MSIELAVEVANKVLNLAKYNNISLNCVRLNRILFDANCRYVQATGTLWFKEKNLSGMDYPQYKSVINCYGQFTEKYITGFSLPKETYTFLQLYALRKSLGLTPNPLDAIANGVVNKESTRYL